MIVENICYVKVSLLVIELLTSVTFPMCFLLGIILRSKLLRGERTKIPQIRLLPGKRERKMVIWLLVSLPVSRLVELLVRTGGCVCTSL